MQSSCSYQSHSDNSSWMESSTISGFIDIPNNFCFNANEMSVDSSRDCFKRQTPESLPSLDYDIDNMEYQHGFNYLQMNSKETSPSQTNTSPSHDVQQQLSFEIEYSALTELGGLEFRNNSSQCARYEEAELQRGDPPPYNSALNSLDGTSCPLINNTGYKLNQYNNISKPPPPYRPPLNINTVNDCLRPLSDKFAQDCQPPPPYAITKAWAEKCKTLRRDRQEYQLEYLKLHTDKIKNKYYSFKVKRLRSRSNSETVRSKGVASSEFEHRTPPPDLTASGGTDVVFPWLPQDTPTSSEILWETVHPTVDEANTADGRLSPATKRRIYDNTRGWRVNEEVETTVVHGDFEPSRMTEGIEDCSNPIETSGSIRERIIQTFAKEKKSSKSEGGGQVHLWQFLLELLSNEDHKAFIQWDGEDGVFVFKKPDEVARMWGDTKKKRDMNYEKLSRSLRYYYEKHIMSKVSGKHYSYKFHLDGLTRAYHPTGVSDSLYIQTYDMNCPSRNFPFPSPLTTESGSDLDERL